MSRDARRIGLVVNPVAGIGGAAGLHGSDGAEVQRLALQRHGRSQAAPKTSRFLRTLLAAVEAVDEVAYPAQEVDVAGTARDRIHWMAAPGIMGVEHLASWPDGVAGVSVVNGTLRPPSRVRHLPGSSGETMPSTTADDTIAAVRAMVEGGADLIVFAGGDGTARDVAGAIDHGVPVIGIPTGVKMQSAVFGQSPESAARAVLQWLRGTSPLTTAEIVDLDESAYRAGIFSSTIFSSVLTIAAPHLVVGRKIGASPGLSTDAGGLAVGAEKRLDRAGVWLLGPGTTVREVASCWGLASSLLGVDIVDGGRVIIGDASAVEITEYCTGRRVQVVLSPIAGQGFLLGRGNQQIGAALPGLLTADDLLVVATEEKLAALTDGCLYLDAPMAETSMRYLRVITGLHSTALVRVVSG